MKLEIGNFHVKDIQFGRQTVYEDGILTVSKEEAIAALNKEGALKNISLEIARPGESVRILPIKAVVEPRFRPDGRSPFPGYIGPAAPAGEGVTYAMKGMSVLGVGMRSVNGMNYMLDMTGPGAELSPHYACLNHLIFIAENADPDADVPRLENLNYEKAAHYLAEYIGKALADKTPEDWERFDHEDISGRQLPRTAFICQQCNIPKWYEGTSYYGFDLTGVPMTLVKPLECLDGALTGDGGSLPANAARTTYSYLNAPIVKRLLAEHGKTLDFVGIMMTGHIEPIDQKKRYAQIFVSTAQLLKLDAAIVMESHCGNVDVDYMMTLGGLESAGIKTVGILAENNGRDNRNPGKTYADPRADAIVSTGNACEVYELPPMDVVYGNLDTIGQEPYWGAWRDDALRGPSLRPDGSLIVDAHMFLDHDGLLGHSDKTVVDF